MHCMGQPDGQGQLSNNEPPNEERTIAFFFLFYCYNLQHKRIEAYGFCAHYMSQTYQTLLTIFNNRTAENN